MFDGEKIDLNGGGWDFVHMCVCFCVCVFGSMIRVNSWIWVRRGLKEMYQAKAIMSTDALRQEHVGWGQGTHRNLVLELELASVEQTRRKAGLLNIQDFRGHFKDLFFYSKMGGHRKNLNAL